MGDQYQISERERQAASVRGGEAIKRRLVRVAGRGEAIGDVMLRTGLTSTQISRRISQLRKRGEAVTWEALT